MVKHVDTDILLRIPAAWRQDIAYLGLEVCG
jgi:hypothetical protein